MADMIANGLAWLAAQQKADVSTAATYSRGNQSVVIQMTLQSQVLRISDRNGNTKVEREGADFTFTYTDLNFGSGQIDPVSGDLIAVTLNGVLKKFKLEPVNSRSEPAWFFCDPYQTQVRVHTKRTV